MGDYLSKNALLGANDLEEADVDVPSIGGKVRVRALSGAYSNQAQSDARKMVQVGENEIIATVDTAKMEIIQLLHGLVEPKLASYQEAEQFSQRTGPAFRAIIDKIDELSAVDKKAIEDAEARFPLGDADPPAEARPGQNGAEGAAAAGDGRSNVPARPGA